MSNASTNSLTLPELPELRRKTEAVSQFLRQQITTHLETLRPLFAPERVFGKNAGGKVDVQGSERALVEVQQSHRNFTRKPYDLPETFDSNWLALVGSALELYPWEYNYPVKGKQITLTSPVRWAVNYRSNYTLAQVKKVVAGQENARPEYLRQFVVNSLVLQLVLQRNPGLAQLFLDLGYELKAESPGELKGLPTVTITSFLNSFRPADDLIEAATAFSGVPAFIELLRLDEASKPRSPFQEKVQELLK